MLLILLTGGRPSPLCLQPAPPLPTLVATSSQRSNVLTASRFISNRTPPRRNCLSHIQPSLLLYRASSSSPTNAGCLLFSNPVTKLLLVDPAYAAVSPQRSSPISSWLSPPSDLIDTSLRTSRQPYTSSSPQRHTRALLLQILQPAPFFFGSAFALGDNVFLLNQKQACRLSQEMCRCGGVEPAEYPPKTCYEPVVHLLRTC